MQGEGTMAQAIVYTSTNCVYCKQLKAYLTEQNVSYEERNVDESEAYFEELQAIGMMSLPVTVIGEFNILGMNTTRIQKALAALTV
jgi:glutaredoxin-like protein NrdH